MSERLLRYEWHKRADVSIRMMEALTASPERANTKWSIGQLNYHMDQLSELLALAPKGVESSVIAYRDRLKATGL